MILLSSIANKLQKVLDEVDTEIPSGASNPTGFQFYVKTAGFHLDNIFDRKTGKNFIPVFVSSLGGEYNPVPQLKEQRQSVSVVFYFPVRFKESFELIFEYLVDVFVGKILTFDTKKALTNLSIAQFGEIQDLDLKQFKDWVGSIYRETIDVNEPYMSMQFSIYLRHCASQFMYGNEATIELRVSDGTLENSYTDRDVVFPDASIQSNSEPAAQQLLNADTPETEGLPVHTSYSSGFTIYYKDIAMYRWLVNQWFTGNSQKLQCRVTYKLSENYFNRNCYLQSVNLSLQKGELITLTFAFAKKKAS